MVLDDISRMGQSVLCEFLRRSLKYYRILLLSYPNVEKDWLQRARQLRPRFYLSYQLHRKVASMPYDLQEIYG